MAEPTVVSMTADGESFETFVRANATALLRTAFLLAGSRPAAEDLLQDTLTHLYPQWDRVSGTDVPLAYVRRSLTNRFVSSRRRASSRELPTADIPDGWDGQDVAQLVADRRQVWQLLGTLGARQRAAVVMRYYHDLTDEEIAQFLDCKPATARSLISRGIAAIRAGEHELTNGPSGTGASR